MTVTTINVTVMILWRSKLPLHHKRSSLTIYFQADLGVEDICWPFRPAINIRLSLEDNTLLV